MKPLGNAKKSERPQPPSVIANAEGETKALRLQVFLSHNGVCSRRKALEMIQQGRVKVNGALNREPSTMVLPDRDRVEFEGKIVGQKEYVYIILNKPAGYVTTTTDAHDEQTVMDLLPQEYKHLKPVGRLDKDTEGLLLLTNDGDLAYRLTHPKFNIDKTYFVRISGILRVDEKIRLEKGVMVEDKLTAPARIRDVRTMGSRSEFLITIHEGRKRQIRLMLETIRHRVIDLTRISQGPLQLGNLSAGLWRRLEKKEELLLRKLKK